jgi:ribonucleoside-diphosphate reductase alpha chain
MSSIHVKKRNGRLEILNVDKINKVVTRACEGLEDVSPSEVVLDAKLQLFDKIPTVEIDKALILTAASKVEKEPNYSYVAARLRVNCIYKEVFGEGVDVDTFELLYKKAFITNTKKLVKANRLDARLLEFDIKDLADYLVPDRDNKFKYLGIKTLHERYLIHIEGRRMETPQGFWMRVAMGLAINEENKNARAKEFYDALSQFNMCCSTPTLFNSGTTHSQLSSCYLNTFEDSIDGIFEGLWQEARKSKYAGGLGFDVTPFRATGSHIEGTNGNSSGLIPWLRLYNDTLIAVNQGGKRPGSGCAYLEPWHLDVEEFIDLRRATGEQRRKTPDMNTALWIPDAFMRAVEKDEGWLLFCPREAVGLHDAFGDAFDHLYAEYCLKAASGQMKQYKVIKAKELWKTILKAVYETSHPWITFKDACNIRYSNQHEGVVHSSNLCTEIMLHTKASEYKEGKKVTVGETAVCNLASPNLPSHVENGEINWEKLAKTIHTSIRMLDNVIDINFYPTEEAANSNLKHRPIGLGLMGFHDVCHLLDVQYDTDAGVQLAGKIQEFIAYHAVLASSQLAKEKGKYSTYEGSLWSKGYLPHDTDAKLRNYRKDHTTNIGGFADDLELDYMTLRLHLKEHGMRNSNVMAIAPTATISYIQGCEQSIEPNFSVLFVYENQSGNTTVINEHFVNDMKKIGLWNHTFAEAVKAVDGDVMLLDIPQKYKDKYKTAFDRDMMKLIEAAGVRQIFMDMGQSLNIWNSSKSLKYMNDLAIYAWKKGLKTTYYWRNRAASKVEKSTVSKPIEVGVLTPDKMGGDTSFASEGVKACSIEAMRRGEVCESCQ